MKRKIITCLAVLSLLMACGLFSADHKLIRQTNMPLDEVCSAYGVPSCSVAAVQEGTIIASAYYGDAVDESVYGIGSVSKSFVAALAFKLQEEGTLNLDDTIGKYLPKFPDPNKNTVTLRELLSMRSGIGDYLTGFQREDYFQKYERNELIQIGLERSALLSQDDFAYSNTNILIARQMIEAAAGTSCEELIREKILIPLELNDTFFAGEKELIRNRLINGYSKTVNDERVDFTNAATSWADLACGMFSTAQNIAEWGYELVYGNFLSVVSKKELLHFLPATDREDYGLCVVRKMLDGTPVILLQGNVPGYTAAVLIWNNKASAVLCNLSDYSGGNLNYAEGIANEIVLSCS